MWATIGPQKPWGHKRHEGRKRHKGRKLNKGRYKHGVSNPKTGPKTMQVASDMGALRDIWARQEGRRWEPYADPRIKLVAIRCEMQERVNRKIHWVTRVMGSKHMPFTKVLWSAWFIRGKSMWASRTISALRSICAAREIYGLKETCE